MIPLFKIDCDKEPCEDPLVITGQMSTLVLSVFNYLFDDLETIQKIVDETNAQALTAINKYVKFIFTKVQNNVLQVTDYLSTYLENVLTEQQVMLNQVAPGLFAEALAELDKAAALEQGGTVTIPIVASTDNGKGGGNELAETIPAKPLATAGTDTGGKFSEQSELGMDSSPPEGNESPLGNTQEATGNQPDGGTYQANPPATQFVSPFGGNGIAPNAYPGGGNATALVGGGTGLSGTLPLAGQCQPTGKLVWAWVQVQLVEQLPAALTPQDDMPLYPSVADQWPGLEGDDDESWYGE